MTKGAVARCPDMLDWVRRASEQASLTASVCTGVFVLAALPAPLRSGRG